MYEMGIAVIVIIIVLALWWRAQSSPQPPLHARDRAAKIVEWFQTTTAPTYVDFKAALSNRSNIVEYHDASRLHRNGALTVDAMMATL